MNFRNDKLSVTSIKLPLSGMQRRNVPDVLKAALIVRGMVHRNYSAPRPDERHIRYSDVRAIKPEINVEFNIEGYPNKSFMDLVTEIKPAQVTLVPDPPEVLTSNAGWDTIKNEALLKEIIQEFHRHSIRTSIFIETDEK